MKIIFNIAMASIVIFNLSLGIVKMSEVFPSINYWLWLVISVYAYFRIVEITDINY